MFTNPNHTISLLFRLQEHIKSEPKTFNMGSWGTICDPKHYDLFEPAEDDADMAVVLQRPACGAVGCIAGSLCIMTGLVKPSAHFGYEDVYVMGWDTHDKAVQELQIDFVQGRRLFLLKSWGNKEGWPEQFETELAKYEPGTPEYVDVTIRRINHFIATGGDE